MNLLALPELPQLAGVLPDSSQSQAPGGQFPIMLPGGGTISIPVSASVQKKVLSLTDAWWRDLPRIGTFLLGFLLIAGALFAPRDIKQAATTAAKAAAL